MKTHLFKLACLTDLHVGNGEANYSIIDNEVQKDTVLQDVPIIHASGVKGSLREHFERIWGKTDPKIKTIFGDKDGAGSYKFFTALCIARPLRVSDGDKPYVLATSPAILEHFSAFLKGLGCTNFYSNERDSLEVGTSIEVEGEPAITKNCAKLELLIGKDFAVIDKLCNYDLPVRARNRLDENGQSQNLWYEELVPHKSIFYFAVIEPGDTKGNDGTIRKSFYEDFLCGIENFPVQFGGNASVGNGYTTIKEVFTYEQTQG
jgi:CRISPR-associated protein Cmr4